MVRTVSSAVAPRGADLVALGRRIRRAQEQGRFTSYCQAQQIHTRKAYDLIAIAEAVDSGMIDTQLVGESDGPRPG